MVNADEDFTQGVYAIENVETGRVYIGSSIHIATRWHGHKDRLRKNKHSNRLLQHDWNIYNESTFVLSILEEQLSSYRLGSTELFWYNVYREEGRELYNLAPPSRQKTSDEVCQKDEDLEVEPNWPDSKFSRPVWHAWVYGGARNPLHDL